MPELINVEGEPNYDKYPVFFFNNDKIAESSEILAVGCRTLTYVCIYQTTPPNPFFYGLKVFMYAHSLVALWQPIHHYYDMECTAAADDNAAQPVIPTRSPPNFFLISFP